MTQLQEPVDFVIGVDTHKHTHTASVIDTRGMELEAFELSADAKGYSRVLRLAQSCAAGSPIWAIKGAGGYGSGRAAHLVGQGERVVVRHHPPPQHTRQGLRNAPEHALDDLQDGQVRGEILATTTRLSPAR